MANKGLTENQFEALWNKAQEAGFSRRKFLIMLASGGAVAVLTACAPRVTTTVTNTVTATPPTPTASPSPTPTPAPERVNNDPRPAQFFLPIGGGNFEMRFEDLANRTYQTPNSLFFVRDHTVTPVVDVSTWKLSIEGDGISNPFTLPTTTF